MALPLWHVSEFEDLWHVFDVGWGPAAMAAVVLGAPDKYAVIYHSAGLAHIHDDQNRHQYPRGRLDCWLIEIPVDDPGIIQIFATWFYRYRLEPGLISTVVPSILPCVHLGKYGQDFRILRGMSYDTVMRQLDNDLMGMLRHDPLLKDTKFCPQTVETLLARFIGTTRSPSISIDALINLLFAAEAAQSRNAHHHIGMHNFIMDFLRQTLLDSDEWLSPSQMERIKDRSPTLRRLCSAQVRFRCIDKHRQLCTQNNRPPEDFFGGLTADLQQTLDRDPRILSAAHSYHICWFHYHLPGQECDVQKWANFMGGSQW